MLNRHHPQRSADSLFEIIEEVNVPLLLINQTFWRENELGASIDFGKIRSCFEGFLNTKNRLETARNIIELICRLLRT
jgi:hypothetical protein